MNKGPRDLLDTNSGLYIINRKPAEVFRHFENLPVGDIGISRITGAELAYGVEKSGSARNRQALEKFLAPLEIMAFDSDAMRQYGQLRARPEKQGTPIEPPDMLIAAHAMALGSILVTDNLREFERIPGLALENWATA
ncbi:MAG: type II toxin-antitoxin system VapC family toxin [Azoarcus sp.]|nr:type II toxin-antitoxin system VapC family toxin [Azoarcus sp.]